MTELQKTVLRMLADGKSYAAIGRELGVTRQDVWQIARFAVKERTYKDYRYYPALIQYMRDNEIFTLRELSERTGVSIAQLSKELRYGSRMRRETAQKVADATGLSIAALMRIQ